MIYKLGIRKLFLMIICFCIITIAHAQDNSLKPVASTFAITNTTVIQSPGKTLQNATVVIKNGVIKAVGISVSIPKEASIIKGDSMYVYPGFISGLASIGLDKPKENESKDDRKLTGTPTYERAGITPNRSARSLLNPKEKSISDFRKLGFTAAHVAPSKGMLPGTGAIILLRGNSADEMLLKENVSFYSQFEGAGGVYPNTVIGVMAKYRDLYRKAQQARSYQNKYASNSNGMERPITDEVIESFFPVVASQLSVMFQAQNVLDITRVIALQKDLGFKLMLGEVKQAWDLTDQLKQLRAPIFLSLDLPELPKDEDEEEKSKESLDEDERTSEEIEKEALEKRKNEMILNYYTQPSKLTSAGINFGFSTLDVKAKDFKANLKNLTKYGVSEDLLLASLTTTPASLLGLSSSMGTIEVGKLGNLLVTDKPYFEEKANVRYVFVEGAKYEYKAKAKKKKESSGEEAIDATGIYNYTAETPRGSNSGVIEIKSDQGSYTGTIKSQGRTTELNEIDVDGSTISFTYTVDMGREIKIDASLTVEEDTFEGTFTIGSFGSFPMEGTKEPNY